MCVRDVRRAVQVVSGCSPNRICSRSRSAEVYDASIMMDAHRRYDHLCGVIRSCWSVKGNEPRRISAFVFCVSSASFVSLIWVTENDDHWRGTTSRILKGNPLRLYQCRSNRWRRRCSDRACRSGMQNIRAYLHNDRLDQSRRRCTSSLTTRSSFEGNLEQN